MVEELTVDNIRDEFRRCLFSLTFSLGCNEFLTGQEDASQKDTVANIAAFGCNSGLISREEYDDWMGVLKDGTTQGAVVLKWCKKKEQADGE